MTLEGYSPLKSTDLGHPVLAGIAEQHGVTPAQVVLRWHLEHGIAVIPKSARPERIAANFDVLELLARPRTRSPASTACRAAEASPAPGSAPALSLGIGCGCAELTASRARPARPAWQDGGRARHIAWPVVARGDHRRAAAAPSAGPGHRCGRADPGRLATSLAGVPHRGDHRPRGWSCAGRAGRGPAPRRGPGAPQHGRPHRVRGELLGSRHRGHRRGGLPGPSAPGAGHGRPAGHRAPGGRAAAQPGSAGRPDPDGPQRLRDPRHGQRGCRRGPGDLAWFVAAAGRVRLRDGLVPAGRGDPAGPGAAALAAPRPGLAVGRGPARGAHRRSRRRLGRPVRTGGGGRPGHQRRSG